MTVHPQAAPRPTAHRPDKATDFNDSRQLCGPEAVHKAVEGAREPDPLPEAQPAPGNRSEAVLGGPWSEPEPIGRTDKSDPYPLEEWPGLAGRAIREVIDASQVPPALAAHAALCAISTAAMGLADVKRAETLVSPAAIFALVLCDSGERKSHVDRLFMRGIEEWQSEHLEEQRLAYRSYLTDKEVWEAKRQGLLARIKKLTERGPGDSKGNGK